MKIFESENFVLSVRNLFENLLLSNKYTDVTFVCEDGKQIQAHRFILTASSPFFSNIFSQSNDTSSFMFLQGVNSFELLAVLKFIYTGGTEVSENNVENFLETAKYLEITGIEQYCSNNLNEYQEPINCNEPEHSNDDAENSSVDFSKHFDYLDQETENIFFGKKGSPDAENAESGKESTRELTCDSNIRSFPCDKCTYMGRTKRLLKDHVFRIHDGGKFPCTLCPYVSLTKTTKYRHDITTHRGLTFECSICFKSFAAPRSLKLHKEYTHEGKRHNCTFCTYSGATMQLLKFHLAKVHKI